MDRRRDELINWLAQELNFSLTKIDALAGDASLRRYFRVILDDTSYIAMDAPPHHENCYPFIAIAKTFAKQGITVPEILAQDLEQGFLLISDFGDQQYLQALQIHKPETLYHKAIDSLGQIQLCRGIDDYTLPFFDSALLHRELMLFYDWVLQKHLQIVLSTQQQQLLQSAFEWIISEVLHQPRICVHRDYHSRNLLLLEDGRVGVLDFQDAVWGPISYDIVSLLKDCYIRWPRESVLNLVNYYHDIARAENILINVPFEQFHNWFELMGIQRHLKALGIFARLDAYYGKPGYLKDMPRTLSYIEDAIVNYPALTGLKVFLQNEVRPRLSVNEARTSAA